LTEGGASQAATEGIMANITEESAFNMSASGGAGEQGLVQMRGDELLAYRQWQRQNNAANTPENQMRFLTNRLQTAYPQLWAAMNAPGVTKEQAAEMFLRGYERPAGRYLNQRLNSIRTQGVPSVNSYFSTQPQGFPAQIPPPQSRPAITAPPAAPTAPAPTAPPPAPGAAQTGASALEPPMGTLDPTKPTTYIGGQYYQGDHRVPGPSPAATAPPAAPTTSAPAAPPPAQGQSPGLPDADTANREYQDWLTKNNLPDSRANKQKFGNEYTRKYLQQRLSPPDAGQDRGRTLNPRIDQRSRGPDNLQTASRSQDTGVMTPEQQQIQEFQKTQKKWDDDLKRILRNRNLHNFSWPAA
jgi:hypothetical protein